MRTCRDCQNDFPDEEFERYVNRGRTYVRPRCRSCHLLKQSEWNKAYWKRARTRGVTQEERVELDVEDTLPRMPEVTALEERVAEQAACKGDRRFTNPRPTGGNAAWQERTIWGPLRSVCDSCPVKAECREWGDWFEPTWYGGRDSLYPERLSVFLGGETPRERIARRQGEKHAAA